MQRIAALHQFGQQLQQSQQFSRVQVKDDRYILLHTDIGEIVVIYFIDTRLSTQAIQQALRDNTLRGIYSLFVLDVMLLPQDQGLCTPSSFLNTMQTLYHGMIYAYEADASCVQVFPVSVRSVGNGATAKTFFYGNPVDPAELSCGHVETSYPMQGFWGTVNFKAQVNFTGFSAQQRAFFSESYQQRTNQQQTQYSTDYDAYERLRQARPTGVRREHYSVLGLSVDANEEQVRAAYRRLARQYHPDLNSAPEAKHRMQEINLAYKMLIQQFS